MTRIANRMQEATDRLMSRMQVNASVAISYKSGVTVVSGIDATVSRTPFDVMHGDVLLAYESRDYIVATADMGALIPASGDLITEPATGRVYEVSMPGRIAVFERIGPGGTVYKIHTKAVV